MPIITKSSPIAKDAPITFTLDKAALAALPVVVADAWFADDANWKKVILNYGSSLGNEMITVSFDATLATPTSSFLAISPSRDAFEIISITIQDFNQGTLRVPTSSLNQAEFIVDFNASFNWNNFLSPNIATTGNGELHREGGGNSFDNAAYYGTPIEGDFVFSGEVQFESFLIGYRRTVPQAGGGYNSLMNSCLYKETGSPFLDKLAGAGDTAVSVGGAQLYSAGTYSFSISRASGVITATFNNVVRFTDNNADPIYLMTSLPNLTALMYSASLIVSPVVPSFFLRDYANPSSPESFESFISSSIIDGKLVFNELSGGAEYTANPSGVEFTQGVQYRYRIYVATNSQVPPSLSFQLGETPPEAHSFSGAQISAARGSFLEYSFTATASQVTTNPFIRLIKNGGSSNEGLSIDKIELTVVAPTPEILAGAYALGSNPMQNITSQITSGEGQSFVLANPASVTVVKVMISKNAGGSPLTGTLNMTLKASDYLGAGAEVVSTNTLDLSTLAESLPILDGGVVCEFLFDTPVSLPSGTNSIKYNYAGLNINGSSIYISVWGYSPTIIDGIAYSHGGPISHVDFWFQILGN
jgi:hypothetical protein